MSGLIERLLRVPIFFKVLLANSAIVVLGAVFGTLVTSEYAYRNSNEPYLGLMLVFGAVGLILSLIVNWIVLRAALSPLRLLTETVDKVSDGNFLARARKTRISDPEIDELTDTLNGMLDSVESHRQVVQRLSSQAITAQEEERKRIARELHDETAQSLTLLLVRLRIAERSRTVEEMRRGISEVRELTSRTLEEVRNLAVELRPSALDDLGLVPALHWHTKHYAETCGIKTDFEARGLDGRLPSDVELVLYRVVQEALTNIAKHSGASHATVLLEGGESGVSARIEDDGRGFAVEETLSSRERGLGLFGMQERLALVGGNLQIDSARGKGTRISVHVPLGPSPFIGLVGARPTEGE